MPIGLLVLMQENQLLAFLFSSVIPRSLGRVKSKLWSSKNSTDAENRAFATVIREVIWLNQLLVGFCPYHVDSGYSKGQSAHHERTKHIKIDCYSYAIVHSGFSLSINVVSFLVF